MRETKFGVAYPTGMEGLMYPVPFCDTTDLIELAVEAESLGYDSIGGNDHIVTQDYVKAEWSTHPRYYDVFTTFAYMAAETASIRLNMAVTVLPIRNPVWVAKQAMTLDRLSDGRVLLGTGVGAYREEFEAVQPDVEAPRGAIMDESIEALSMLLEDGPARYDGRFIRFEDVDLHPKPVQEPFPIYVGGNHPKAMERAVRYGHGWLPAAITPAELTERREDLEAMCAEFDRRPDDVDVAPQLIASIDRDGNVARRKFKRSQVFSHLKSLTGSTLKEQSLDDVVEQNLIGTPDEIIEHVERYHEAGVSHFPAIIFAANDVDELTAQMTLFADGVMGSFG